MKILILTLCLLTSTLQSEELPKQFLNAIHQVEAGGRIRNVDGSPIVGDNGKALGPFQIHYAYWVDSNVAGNYTNCADYNYSVKVVTAYLNRYGARQIREKNWEVLARMHNGGPNGHKKQATIKYWNKVKKHL